MKTIVHNCIRAALAAVLALAPLTAAGEETLQQKGEAAQSLQKLVTEALNPVSMLVKIPFQNNFDLGVGADRVTRSTLNIEPIVPFSLTADWNLITRTIIPLVSQPAAGPGQESMAGLGDINPSFFLSPAHHGHQFWGIGPTLTIPTGTAPHLSSGKWTLGPAAVYMATPGPWMLGAVVNHQWSIAGWSGQKVNESTLQPMLMYHLPRGWYLVSIPLITADWDARAGDRWTVPVGGGAGRMIKLDSMPLNLQLQAFYNVEHPHERADWQLRFQILLLFPK